jgi:hypothetical protein
LKLLSENEKDKSLDLKNRLEDLEQQYEDQKKILER